jgi:hypothetical protein
MVLHRDIYWVGRQWAVTGHGLQACDQKQKGKFDIEAARLWDDGLVETMHAKEWLNAADFDKGLEIARKRYAGQPHNAAEPSKETPKETFKETFKETPKEIFKDTLKETFKEPPKAEPPEASVLPPQPSPPVAPLRPAPRREKPKPQEPVPIDLKQKIAEIKVSMRAKRNAVEPPKPVLPAFQARYLASAKFVKLWRVRQKK